MSTGHPVPVAFLLFSRHPWSVGIGRAYLAPGAVALARRSQRGGFAFEETAPWVVSGVETGTRMENRIHTYIHTYIHT